MSFPTEQKHSQGLSIGRCVPVVDCKLWRMRICGAIWDLAWGRVPTSRRQPQTPCQCGFPRHALAGAVRCGGCLQLATVDMLAMVGTRRCCICDRLCGLGSWARGTWDVGRGYRIRLVPWVRALGSIGWWGWRTASWIDYIQGLARGPGQTASARAMETIKFNINCYSNLKTCIGHSTFLSSLQLNGIKTMQ